MVITSASRIDSITAGIYKNYVDQLIHSIGKICKASLESGKGKSSMCCSSNYYINLLRWSEKQPTKLSLREHLKFVDH